MQNKKRKRIQEEDKKRGMGRKRNTRRKKEMKDTKEMMKSLYHTQ